MVEKTVPLKVIIQMEDITDADKELASNAVLIFLLLNLRVSNCILWAKLKRLERSIAFPARLPNLMTFAPSAILQERLVFLRQNLLPLITHREFSSPTRTWCHHSVDVSTPACTFARRRCICRTFRWLTCWSDCCTAVLWRRVVASDSIRVRRWRCWTILRRFGPPCSPPCLVCRCCANHNACHAYCVLSCLLCISWSQYHACNAHPYSHCTSFPQWHAHPT